MTVLYKQVTRDADRKCVPRLELACVICVYKAPAQKSDKLYTAKRGTIIPFKMNMIILAGLLVATLVSQSSGAAMMPEHPQTAFCKADFGEASVCVTCISYPVW